MRYQDESCDSALLGGSSILGLSQEAKWYACRTRARAEKQVDRLLVEQGFDVYTPLVELDRQWADRKKRVEFPMFPGYTFASFSLEQYLDVLRVPGIVHVVGTQGRLTPVRREELDSVRRFAEGIRHTGTLPEPVDYLEPGTPVEVTSGPFRGMRGSLLEGDRGARVAVRLGAIRVASSVELDRKDLRPLRS